MCFSYPSAGTTVCVSCQYVAVVSYDIVDCDICL